MRASMLLFYKHFLLAYSIVKALTIGEALKRKQIFLSEAHSAYLKGSDLYQIPEVKEVVV